MEYNMWTNIRYLFKTRHLEMRSSDLVNNWVD